MICFISTFENKMVVLKSQIEKIKALMLTKGEQVEYPEHNTEAIVVREQDMRGSYSASIGLGKISSINVRYFEVRGFVFDERLESFNQSILKIEPKEIKRTRALEYTCVVFKTEIMRGLMEASFASKLSTLDDCLAFLKTLE